MRTIDAPSPGDQTGRADEAARISRAAPVAVPNGSSKRVAKGTRAIDAPTPGTIYRGAFKVPPLPAPAAEPGATMVPEGDSPTVAEEGVSSRMRTIGAPSPDDPTGGADTAAPTLMTSPATDPDWSSTLTVTTEWLSIATRDAGHARQTGHRSHVIACTRDRARSDNGPRRRLANGRRGRRHEQNAHHRCAEPGRDRKSVV